MVGACPEPRRVQVGKHVRGGRARRRRIGDVPVNLNLPVRVLTTAFDRYDGNQTFLVVSVVNHTPVADAVQLPACLMVKEFNPVL